MCRQSGCSTIPLGPPRSTAGVGIGVHRRLLNCSGTKRNCLSSICLRLVQEAGSTTRKLIARPCELVSIGAIAPSIEQYAGALLPLTHLGAARLTPATGSPIAEAEMVVPSRSLVQSSAEITLAASAAGAWEDTALDDNTIKARRTATPFRRFIVLSPLHCNRFDQHAGKRRLRD